MTERKSYTSLSIETEVANIITKTAEKNKITHTEQVRRWMNLADHIKNGVN